MLSTLLALTISFLFLTIYCIVQSNLNWFSIDESKFWSLKILDTPSSATLFVTLVGALLVRHQFAIGVLPRINYVSGIKKKQNALKPIDSYETWEVEIRNTGLGAAIITHINYLLELANHAEKAHDYTFNSLVKKLAEINLVRDNDYSLFNISSGFSLSPKDEYVIFEIKTEHISKLKSLSILIQFEGQLGDKYSREISLIGKVN